MEWLTALKLQDRLSGVTFVFTWQDPYHRFSFNIDDVTSDRNGRRSWTMSIGFPE
jgi:hypothetical protein